MYLSYLFGSCYMHILTADLGWAWHRSLSLSRTWNCLRFIVDSQTMSQQTTNFYHNMEVCATTVFTIEYIMCLELFIRVPIRRATQKSDSSRFRISGFGFRRLKPTFAVGFGFRVSGFGFRRLKPTFAVAFGFRVSGFVDWNPLSLSVSGFGFRVSSLETNFRCPFRVSGFVDWNPLLLSVSGFGFRVSSLETNFRCRFRVSGFGFRRLKTNFRCRFRVSGFGFRVSSPETNFRCRFRISGFGFRVSGFVDWS